MVGLRRLIAGSAGTLLVGMFAGFVIASAVGVFVQDTWTVKRMTINAGLRWDYFPMGTRLSRGMERYNFDTNQMSICGVGGRYTRL